LRRDVLVHILAIAAFALLTLLVTMPLASHLHDGVLGSGAGDNLSALWNIWWARTATSGAEPLFSTPALFAPLGTSLVLHSFAPLESTTAGWLSADPVTGYNAALLAAVFLNFLCAYWAALTVTGDWRGALLAGVTFGASPFLLVRLQGHLNVLSAWGLPLLLGAAVRYERRPTMTSAVALAMSLAVVAYTDYYYAIFGAVMLAAYLALHRWPVRLRSRATGPPEGGRYVRRRTVWVLGALIVIDVALIAWIQVTGGVDTSVAGIRLRMTESFNPRVVLGFLIIAALVIWTRPALGFAAAAGSRPELWRLLPITIATAALLVAPLIVAGVRLWINGDYESQVYFWRSAPPGIDVATFVLGNPLSAITGGWTRGVLDHLRIDRVESTAWAGVLPLVLVALAIRNRESRAAARPFLWIGGLFLVWSLGPYLRVFGVNTGFMLPQTFLHFVPIVSNARIPGRAFVVVQLMIAIVGAQALTTLATTDRVRTVLAVMATTLVLVDFRPGAHPWLALDRPAIYDVLRSQPPGVVLEVPLGYRDGFGQRGRLDHRALFYQTIHEHPLTGGFVARLSSRIKNAYESDPLIAQLLDLSEGRSVVVTPTPPALPAPPAPTCISCSVRYVVVDEAFASPELQSFVTRSFALQPLARSGARALYSIGPR
jgi:hypothetical protein